MYPRLGGIENLDGMLLYYPILAIAVFAVNVLIFWGLARQGYRPTRLIPFQLALSLGGFLGAKLYSIAFRGELRSLHEELEGGWRYPGALLGMLAAAWLARRLLPRGLTAPVYLDVWAPSFAIACAIGRIGCLLNGCCYGTIAALPWAIQFPYGSIAWYAHRDGGVLATGATISAPVHPFQVYLMVMELGLAAYLVWLKPRARYEGQVVLQFLAIHGIAKGALESFRDPFNWMHLVVVPIGLVALIVMIVPWRPRRRSFDPGSAAESLAGAPAAGA